MNLRREHPEDSEIQLLLTEWFFKLITSLLAFMLVVMGFSMAYADTLWINGEEQRGVSSGSTITSPIIIGGTIDDAIIGGTTPVAGSFVDLNVSNAAASAGWVDFFEDSSSGSNYVRLIGPASTNDITLTLQAIAGTIYSSGGTDVVDGDVADALTISGGTVDNSIIGGTTPVAGSFVDLNVSNGATGPGYVDFFENSGNGSNYVRLIGPAATTDISLTLQAIAGTVYSTGGVDVSNADVADDITLTNITQITTKPITALSATNWKMFYSGAGAIPIELTLGANGTFLESNGASAAPAFRTLIDADIPDALTIAGGTVNSSIIGGSTAAAGTFTDLDVDTSATFSDVPITNVGDIALDSISPDGTNVVVSVTDNVDAFLIGNKTPVASLTAVTVATAALNHADIDTATAVGDLVHIISGAGVTPEYYRIISVGSDTVSVDRAPGGSGSDIVCVIYKDVVMVTATDGTNGQRIVGFSHQDMPLQIGGDTIASTGHSLGAEDVMFASTVEFNNIVYFDTTTTIADDRNFTLGTTSNMKLRWDTNSTADEIGQLYFIESDGTVIPILVISDASFSPNSDTTFDDITEPSIGFMDDDADSWVRLGFIADDEPGIDTDGDTFTVHDPFRSKFSTVEESADAATLSVAECSDTLVTNRGWDGNDDQTFTLPDADTVVGAGLKFKFLAVVASGATADTYFDTEGATTKIYLDGTAGADGHRIWFQEVAVGESIVCHTATIDGTTYDWYCDSINGVCADKGS